MISVKVTARIDRGRWNRTVKRAGYGGLRGAAAYIRKVARNSVKARGNYNKSSLPGTPPHTHGSFRYFKNSIAFSVDGNTAYIGPAALPGKQRAIKNMGAIHEFGGEFQPSTGRRKRVATDWNTAKAGPVDVRHGVIVFGKLKTDRQRRRAWKIAKSGATFPKGKEADGKTGKLLNLETAAQKGKMFHYPARPTMGPALKKVLPKLPQFWKNEKIKINGGISPV